MHPAKRFEIFRSRQHGLLANEVEVDNLRTNKPQKLGGHIVFGKSAKLTANGEYADEQFEGFVSNVNFYWDRNLSIETLSR